MGSEPSRVKVALFGPSKVGKSTFKAVLLGESLENVVTPSKEPKVVEENRKFKKMVRGELRPLETYKLGLVDLPGRDTFQNERLQEIAAGVIGCCLFYDASDPSSAQKLVDMVQEELIKTEYLERFMGVMIIGNTRGEEKRPHEAIDHDAINIVEKLRERLNSQITSTWGYEVPHLLISCNKRQDVALSFFVIESLLSSREVPQQVLKKYSALRKREEIKEKRREIPEEAKAEAPTPPKPKPPEEKAPEEAKAEAPTPPKPKPPEEKAEKVQKPKKPKAKAKPKILDYSLSLFPSKGKAWQLSEKLVANFPQIGSAVVCKVQDKEVHSAFYPGESSFENIPQQKTKLLVFFHRITQNYKEEHLKRVILKRNGRWFVLINYKETLVLVQTKEEPPEKVRTLFGSEV